MSRRLLGLSMGLATVMLLVATAQPALAFPCYCNGEYLGDYDDVMSCFNDCGAGLQEPMTTERRSELWRQSFAQFSDRHQDLTDGQAEILLRAIDMVAPGPFQDSLDDTARAELIEFFKTFQEKFSTSQYLELIASSRELSEWLAINGVIGLDPIPTCNCRKDRECSSFYFCNQGESCISAAGSKANGVCSPIMPTFL